MKQYLANTPLILQDENGEDFRVERGEIIELSDTQYAEVSAHVTPLNNSFENQQEKTDEQSENQTETPTETADKPKRGKAKDAE